VIAKIGMKCGGGPQHATATHSARGSFMCVHREPRSLTGQQVMQLHCNCRPLIRHVKNAGIFWTPSVIWYLQDTADLFEKRKRLKLHASTVRVAWRVYKRCVWKPKVKNAHNSHEMTCKWFGF
jgi:hypothetical protein